MVCGDVVFSGDTLFQYSIGRTDFPGGSYQQLINSIKTKLMPLDDKIVVYSGHGPQTTIGAERRGNPFPVSYTHLGTVRNPGGSLSACG